MNKWKRNITKYIRLLFGIGIFVVTIMGVILFAGYIAAILVGGQFALTICTFLYNKFIPVMVYTSTTMILVGIITLYLIDKSDNDLEDPKGK